jgi:hypothetical protein
VSPEVDENSRISVRRKIAQDLSELARGEFARSTRAAHHFGEAFLAEECHCRNITALSAAWGLL